MQSRYIAAPAQPTPPSSARLRPRGPAGGRQTPTCPEHAGSADRSRSHSCAYLTFIPAPGRRNETHGQRRRRTRRRGRPCRERPPKRPGPAPPRGGVIRTSREPIRTPAGPLRRRPGRSGRDRRRLQPDRRHRPALRRSLAARGWPRHRSAGQHGCKRGPRRRRRGNRLCTAAGTEAGLSTAAVPGRATAARQRAGSTMRRRIALAQALAGAPRRGTGSALSGPRMLPPFASTAIHGRRTSGMQPGGAGRFAGSEFGVDYRRFRGSGEAEPIAEPADCVRRRRRERRARPDPACGARRRQAPRAE